MKVNRTHQPVIRGGVQTESTFSINTSAHAFEILSSGLYTDSVTAVVRELSCNAYDSHVMAGKTDVPFEIHIPNRMEPWFSIRDFGTGLSPEDISGLYTTYFESTKSDSDEFIGGLGLGSKSPFSYTKDFTVTSYFNGTAYQYSIFINEVGVPSVATMGEFPTEEDNGIMVKFNSEDNSRFFDAVSHYLAYFPVKPIVTGTHANQKDAIYSNQRVSTGSDLDVDGKWFITSQNHGYRSRPLVIYGQVPYPSQTDKIVEGISNILDKKYVEFYRKYSDRLVFTFGVEALNITANREELKYTDLTISSFAARIEEFVDMMLGNIKAIVAKFDDNHSVYKTVQHLLHGHFANDASLFQCFSPSDLDCPAFAGLAAFNNNDLSRRLSDGITDVFELSRFKSFYSYAKSGNSVRKESLSHTHIDVGGLRKVVYYVVDDKKFGVAKAKDHFLELPPNTYNYAIFVKPIKNSVIGTPEFDAALLELKGAIFHADIIYTSTLTYNAPTRAAASGSKKQLGTVFSYGDYGNWNFNSSLDFAAGGTYLYLPGGTSVYKNSKAVSENIVFGGSVKSETMDAVVRVYNVATKSNIKATDVIGVSAADIKTFDDDAKWVNLLSVAETHLSKYKKKYRDLFVELDSLNAVLTDYDDDVNSTFNAVFKRVADAIESDKLKELGLTDTHDMVILATEIAEMNTRRKRLGKLIGSIPYVASQLIKGFEGFAGDIANEREATRAKIVAMSDRYTGIANQYPVFQLTSSYHSVSQSNEALQLALDYVKLVDQS